MTLSETKEKSDCCNASVHVSCGDEGTCCYVCVLCNKPCDLASTQSWDDPAVVEAYENPKEDWEKEFERQFAGATGYCNSKYATLIKNFIRSLLHQRDKEIVGILESLLETEIECCDCPKTVRSLSEAIKKIHDR